MGIANLATLVDIVPLVLHALISKTKSERQAHHDVIKWKHFPRNWPFVREIHRSPVNFPHKGQWRGALMFSLIYAWINDWVNNREAGDLRRQHGHYDVIVMYPRIYCRCFNSSPPSTTYMRQGTGPALFQVMACRLFSPKPLPEPMLSYCQLDTCEQISVEFESEFFHFHSGKCI